MNEAQDPSSLTGALLPQAPSGSLREAIHKSGIEGVTDEQAKQLDRYCQLLWEWNERLNLTRHTSYDLFVRRDLLDSLKLVEQLRPNEEILDIGTGGGVPGLVIAILRPDIEVTLCDSVGKKANAVDQMVKQLGLAIPVYATRAQDLLRDFRYDSLVTRAVGPLPRLLGWLTDHWHSFNRLLAIKGPQWVTERGEARHRGLLKGIELRKISEYRMPDTNSSSVILQFRRPRPGESMNADSVI